MFFVTKPLLSSKQLTNSNVHVAFLSGLSVIGSLFSPITLTFCLTPSNVTSLSSPMNLEKAGFSL
ncbi:MAG: hypothetical protein MJ233_05525 [Mycoplasmoidaceae bacterium]|nr:hypothetical protein [Mycoplasmoidaceae bacterium]